MDNGFSIEHLGIKLDFPSTAENDALISEFMEQCSEERGKNGDIILQGRSIKQFIELMRKLAEIQEVALKRTREYISRLESAQEENPYLTINLSAIQKYTECTRALETAQARMARLKHAQRECELAKEKWIMSMEKWTSDMKIQQANLNAIREEKLRLEHSKRVREKEAYVIEDEIRKNQVNMFRTMENMRRLSEEANRIDREGRRIQWEEQRIEGNMLSAEEELQRAQENFNAMAQSPKAKTLAQKLWPYHR